MQISPLVKLAISLIIGISIAQHVYFVPSFYPTAIGITAFLMILILLVKQDYRNKAHQFGLAACVFMVLVGFLRTKQADQSLNVAHFSKNTYQQLHVVVDDTPIVRGKSVRMVLKVVGGCNTVGARSAHPGKNCDEMGRVNPAPTMGKIMAYFAIDSLSTQLRYGDVLIIRNRV
ncbi:MAG: DUF4131 domain-containing protein, partial [Bacteroidales bacterium]|nr:DUF4131 domain-containing protein [Bacteroidales bacterium]